VKLRKKTDDEAALTSPSANGDGPGRHAVRAVASSDGTHTVPRQAAAATAVIERPEGWQPLGELLVARQAVTTTQLNEALLQQSASGKRVGALLVELGALDELELARCWPTSSAWRWSIWARRRPTLTP